MLVLFPIVFLFWRFTNMKIYEFFAGSDGYRYPSDTRMQKSLKTDTDTDAKKFKNGYGYGYKKIENQIRIRIQKIKF